MEENTVDKPVEITYTKDYQGLSVYINGVEHFNYLWDNYSHRQQWKDGYEGTRFMIEITMKEGEPLLLGYDDRDTWVRIIAILNGSSSKKKKIFKG